VYGALQATLWEREPQGAPLQAQHLKALFDPIAIYCQRSLYTRPDVGDEQGQEYGIGANMEVQQMPGLTLFDQSTLVQVERKLVSIQRAQRSAGCMRSLTCARARRWLAWCGHVAYQTQQPAVTFQGWRKAEVRQIRSKSSVLFDDLEASRSMVMMDNPMHTGGTSTPDVPRLGLPVQHSAQPQDWTGVRVLHQIKSQEFDFVNPLTASIRGKQQDGDHYPNATQGAGDQDPRLRALTGLEATAVDETGVGDMAAPEPQKRVRVDKNGLPTTLSMASKSVAKI